MSDTRKRIEADIKAAMLARNEVARDTLRLVIADVKKTELDKSRDATEEDVIAALSGGAKRRQESIEQFDRAGRKDLADKERAELAVIAGYLPKQMDEDLARSLINDLIAELKLTSKKDVGLLMKAVMARHKGALDGKLAQKLAMELLP
ncbi:MAG TPA: GatB/YqeY domain-containing protein [Planctomycetota bacterium]|nr:GatB/YqeY domain-containing protein [Planctomycetota bacterium]